MGKGGTNKTKDHYRDYMETQFSGKLLKIYTYMKEIKMESPNIRGDKILTRYLSSLKPTVLGKDYI